MAEPDAPSAPNEEAAADVAQASDLCTQCGMCCMGALHNDAKLDPEEVAGARTLGLPVLPGRPAFSLPCPRFTGTICSIYENRPRACVNYRCRQLEDLQAGITDFENALAHVRIAKAMMEQLRWSLPDSLRQRGARFLLGKDPAVAAGLEALPRRQRMELKLMVTALQLYLDNHFRRPKDGNVMEFRPVSEEGNPSHDH